MRTLTLVAVASLALAADVEAQARENRPAPADTAYAPGEYRAFTGAGERAELDDVVAEMGRHDVVFIGEAHDDPTGHMLEAELLRLAWERYGATGAEGDARRAVVLSLEFFQRDVQPILDEYVAGLIAERHFLDDSRPWPRYETDYRPLIEFAKAHGVPVVAANAPRRYVARVTADGRDALEELDARARRHLAPLPYGEASDAYRDQWIAIISDVIAQEGTKCGRPLPESEDGEEAAAPHGSHDTMGHQLDAQLLWDATMAHSIAMALEREPDALVLHMVGGFHVERGTGTPEQLEVYRPDASWMSVIMRPVEDVERFEPAPEGAWGDFVIQTEAARTLEEIECRAYLDDLDEG